MKVERRFRLLNQDGYDTIKKGKIYSEYFSPGVSNFLKILEKYPNDWEEVFDNEEQVNCERWDFSPKK